MSALAQLQPGGAAFRIPDIPWAAISPELVLFGVGILVLLLFTAGEQRLQAAFVAFGALVAGAGFAWWQTGHTVLPAVVALGAAAQFALTAIWRDRPRMLGAILTGLGFAACIGVTAWQWGVSGDGTIVGTDTLLVGMFAVDGLALFTRVTICVAGLLTVPLGYAYMEERRIHRGEYYPLLLFAATGMTLLAASADFLMLFVALEVLSLALYILAGFAKRDLNSQESAIKYFLLSAFASALLLYGIALIYGAAGTTNIAAAGRIVASVDAPAGLTLAGMTLLFVGFAFKTSLVPFHMWTPDVYQGAPTPITGFMAGATKAAAFAAFIRVFVGGFGFLQWSWLPVFWLIAALTMLVGAVMAIVQADAKRMLAYSAVAHAGYALVGLMTVSREGISATLFYLLIYAVMSLGAFGVLSLLERRGRKAIGLDDLKGVGRRYPVPAGMLGLFLLSLAGIPGTAGFWAKFGVFSAAFEAGMARDDMWLIALVVIGLVSSVIAAFFYIRVIWVMFMEPEPEGVPVSAPLRITTGVQTGLSAAAAAVIVLGVLPGLLVDLARQAASLAG